MTDDLEQFDLDQFDDEMFDETKSIMKDRFGEFLEAYLEDVEDNIRYVTEALEGGDLTTVVDYAHPLKSSSARVGMASVAELSKMIEHMGREALENNTPLDEKAKQAAALLGPALEKAKQRLQPYL